MSTLLRMRKHVPLLFACLFIFPGCRTAPKPGALAPRCGDEIVIAGQFFHTGAKVVLWMDPGGYDAYRVERRFSKYSESSWEATQAATKDLSTPNRYGVRGERLLSSNQLERVRGGGWDLPLLQNLVDQFVLHYDACGTSRQCFKVRQDVRDLSVHFMLDLDGTIYQTLDVKERAWHASIANTRAVGIEIANIGAHPPGQEEAFREWYRRDSKGAMRVTIPARFGDGGLRTAGFVARPARAAPIQGVVQGQTLRQYDFTPEQYRALIQLTATLCKVFPKLKCDYPRDAAGQFVPRILPDDEYERYHGLLGHFHIQTNKVDPGPAFQWDYVINQVRELLQGPAFPRPRWSDRALATQ